MKKNLKVVIGLIALGGLGVLIAWLVRSRGLRLDFAKLEFLITVAKFVAVLAAIAVATFIVFFVAGGLKDLFLTRRAQNRTSESSGETPPPSKNALEGGRPSRRIVAFVFWLSTLIAVFFIPLEWYFRLAIWLTVFGATFPLFVVSVPKVTGLVAINRFNGKLKIFGPGLNIKFPWDEYSDEDFFSLEVVTKPGKDKSYEETYPAEDGPLMLTKWSFQHQPELKRLDRYIYVDETTITTGFKDVLSGMLSGAIGKEESEDARKEVKKLETEVIDQFTKEKTVDVRGNAISPKEHLEGLYGINFLVFALADIDFDENYQAARAGKARAQVLADAAKKVKVALPDLSEKEALNATLLEQGKGTTKNIFEVEELVDALGKAIRIFKGGA